jgi:hypothetical protein
VDHAPGLRRYRCDQHREHGSDALGRQTSRRECHAASSRQHPYLVLGANMANYLVLVLCIGVVARIYLVRGVWERVVTSTTVHNLDGAEGVRLQGAMASALGEGFADSLDIAGF